ncbi:Protein of unknown function [Gryllus bimaculatus]|nr:Protein of unknown function [Gryllus bimaculatus]
MEVSVGTIDAVEAKSLQWGGVHAELMKINVQIQPEWTIRITLHPSEITHWDINVPDSFRTPTVPDCGEGGGGARPRQDAFRRGLGGCPGVAKEMYLKVETHRSLKRSMSRLSDVRHRRVARRRVRAEQGGAIFSERNGGGGARARWRIGSGWGAVTHSRAVPCRAVPCRCRAVPSRAEPSGAEAAGGAGGAARGPAWSVGGGRRERGGERACGVEASVEAEAGTHHVGPDGLRGQPRGPRGGARRLQSTPPRTRCTGFALGSAGRKTPSEEEATAPLPSGSQSASLPNEELSQ